MVVGDPEITPWNGEHPQVKLLADELFVELGAGGDGYSDLLFAEYGHPEQAVDQQEFRWGVLTTISFPASAARPEWVTHLIFGGCAEPQAREYLVSVGLGGVPIATVYGPGATVEENPAEDPEDDEL